MSKAVIADNWAIEQRQARQSMVERGGKPGVASPNQLAGLSGRQVLEGMMAGTLPHPHMNESLGFDLIEVGDGHAVCQGVPDIRYYDMLARNEPCASIHRAFPHSLGPVQPRRFSSSMAATGTELATTSDRCLAV